MMPGFKPHQSECSTLAPCTAQPDIHITQATSLQSRMPASTSYGGWCIAFWALRWFTIKPPTVSHQCWPQGCLMNRRVSHSSIVTKEQDQHHHHPSLSSWYGSNSGDETLALKQISGPRHVIGVLEMHADIHTAGFPHSCWWSCVV